jgi:hypothetical protein
MRVRHTNVALGGHEHAMPTGQRTVTRAISLVPLVASITVACGSRTMLDYDDTSPGDAGHDVAADVRDARARDVIAPDAPDDVDLPPVDFGDAAVCCEDGQNTQYPPDDNCGGVSLGWEYIPSCNLRVKGIELHNRGGAVSIHADANGKPGVVLWDGTLPPPATSGNAWVGTTVSPLLPLVKGRRYWIQAAAGPCSIATGGDQQAYYGWWGGGTGWDGPFHWHHYTSRVHGECN